MEEMKPCPFCGGKMQIAQSQLFTSEGVLDGYYGRCTACYARLAPEETRQKAVTACNRRSEPAINDFMDGIKYAIYEILKEADIPGSQEIRDSGDTDDGMCARAAERIRAELTAAPENKPLTNADRIRNMSNEELAATLMCPNEMGMAEIECDRSDNKNCCQCLLNWLNQPEPPKGTSKPEGSSDV